MIYLDNPQAGMVQNVFGEWMAPEPDLNGPVKTIAVTPEMQHADAERSARRERTTWKPSRGFTYEYWLEGEFLPRRA